MPDLDVSTQTWRWNAGRILKGIKVVAVGPGLSTRGEAPEFVRAFVAKYELADGDRCGCAECVCGTGGIVEWRADE